MSKSATRAAVCLALVSLHGAASSEDVTLTGDQIACQEIAFHAPGPLQHFEGVYFSWIDNDGFVPCRTAAECKRFIELDSLAIEATDEGWNQINASKSRLSENWGVYLIRFEGRRGAMTLPTCEFDHSMPDLPAYVRVEKLISFKRLGDLDAAAHSKSP